MHTCMCSFDVLSPQAPRENEGSMRGDEFPAKRYGAPRAIRGFLIIGHPDTYRCEQLLEFS